MISWIQKYFQHHFKTVFAVLLAITIITFILGINASGGLGRSDHRVVERQFFEYNLGLPDDQQRLYGDARLSVGLQVGSFSGIDAEQIQNYAFQRGAAIHLADTWHIPTPTTAEVTDAIKALRMFAGPDGQFDAKAYQTFRDNLKTNPTGAKEGDFLHVIADDVRVEKVNKLLAGPGYVLPADVKTQLTRTDTSWTLGTGTLDYAAFKVDLKPTDAELTTAFEQSGGRYDIPPRIVASYVEFNALSYIGSVKVTDAEVRAYYDSNPSKFPKPPEVKPAADAKAPVPPPAPDPAADFAAVRSQVETTLKLERAKQIAAKNASDLALALFESKVANGAPLDAFLAARNTPAKPLEPFTREAGPVELAGSQEVATEAFKLNKDRFASEAIPTGSGAVLVFWKDLQPTRKPLFSEVREKILADYLETERRKRFVELGRTVKTQLEARLKAGDTFEKAAAAVTAAKLEAKTIPAFTMANRPPDLDYAVYGTLEHLEKGQLSDMAVNADKGLFVYAVDKKAPDFSASNPRYLEVRNQLASYTARLGGSAYISELIDQELKKSEPKAP